GPGVPRWRLRAEDVAVFRAGRERLHGGRVEIFARRAPQLNQTNLQEHAEIAETTNPLPLLPLRSPEKLRDLKYDVHPTLPSQFSGKLRRRCRDRFARSRGYFRRRGLANARTPP